MRLRNSPSPLKPIYSDNAVMCLPVDVDQHLIEMPAPIRPVAPVYPSPPDLAGAHRTEPVPPVLHRFMTDVDALFVEQVLDLPREEWESNLYHHGKPDDLG